MNLIADFAVLASRRVIFELPVCDLEWEDALEFVSDLAIAPEGQTVVTFVNAHNMLVLLKDEKYRSMMVRSLVLPDGVGLDIASKIAHGVPFPANLNGTDFVPALLTYIDRPLRIGLVGGKGEVVDRAAASLQKHAPWHRFVAISDGYFGTTGNSKVVAEIAEQKLDILIIGMGTPLQEKWVGENILPHHARLVLTVGALFDFVAGVVPRAPAVVRRFRLEWAYRMLQEPSRLWRRYLLGIPAFLHQVVLRKLKGPSVILVPSSTVLQKIAEERRSGRKKARLRR